MGLFTDVEEMATVTYVVGISGSISSDNSQDHDDTINYIDDIATVIYNHVDLVSGTITSTPGTLINLVDVQGHYDDGKCIMSTASGTEWGFPIVYEVSDETSSSTSSTSFQQKLRLTADNMVAGKYKISWSWEWSHSSSSSEIILRVQLDDTTDLANYNTKPVPADSSKFTCCGGFYYTTLSEGTHSVDVDWCSSTKGKTSSIRRVRLDAWRVS